jgi:hypothetical protein
MGRGRVKLKFMAIAYACSMHGIGADIERVRGARELLDNAAAEYYEAVTGTGLKKLLGEHDLHVVNSKLYIVAIAYMNARHGVDADSGLVRAGLALLCNYAIEHCETLLGDKRPNKRAVDPHLHLDNGA